MLTQEFLAESFTCMSVKWMFLLLLSQLKALEYCIHYITNQCAMPTSINWVYITKKVLVLIIRFGLGLCLGLERILKYWSWSWSKFLLTSLWLSLMLCWTWCRWVNDCGVECHQANSLWLHSCFELVLVIAIRLKFLENVTLNLLLELVIAVNLVIVSFFPIILAIISF